MTATDPKADDRVYRAARERAEAAQGRIIHLLGCVVVNAALFWINWVTTGGDGPWWFY